MFIAHGERLRKYAPWILAGVLLVLLPSFVVLFSPSGRVKGEKAELPTIRGKPVNQAEFQRARNIVMAQLLMRTGRSLPRSLEVEDEVNIEAIQHLVLMRKAKELGIRASDEDVVRQIRALFVTEQGQFDPGRYQQYALRLNSLGISQMQFEEIIREQVTLSQLLALITTAAKVTPTELKLRYTPLHEETTINYVAFDMADYKEPIPVTEDEARAYYEQHKEVFRKPAQVKVRHVYFTLADARKSITITDDEIAEYYERNKDKYLDAEKKPKPLADVQDEVKQDLLDLRAERLAGDRATGFSVKLVHEPGTARPDFAQIAADSGVTPHETDFFTIRDSVSGVEASNQFNQAAFALSPEVPFSDPVRGEDGYYVLEYVASQPSEIPPFETAKQQVIDRLKRQHAFEATVKQGRDLAGKVKEAVAAGKSFADACAALKLKPKTSEPFSVTAGATNLPAASVVKETVLAMATNSVSEFIPTVDGGLFFHLKERTPPKLEDFEKDRKQFEAALLDRDRQAIFSDWVNTLMREERVEYKRKASPRQQQQLPAEEAEPAEQPAPQS